MNWNAPATFEQAPIGSHVARIIKIVDIGTQYGEYKGEPTKRKQVIITWELPNETRDDGQPFIISKFYTASLHEKSGLFKDLTNWLGQSPKGIHPKSLLGQTGQVIISQREGSERHVVSGLASLPKGMKVDSTPHNAFVYFSLDPSEYDSDVFDSLSDGLKKMITASPEYMRAVSEGFDIDEKSENEDSDDVPF